MLQKQVYEEQYYKGKTETLGKKVRTIKKNELEV